MKLISRAPVWRFWLYATLLLLFCPGIVVRAGGQAQPVTWLQAFFGTDSGSTNAYAVTTKAALAGLTTGYPSQLTGSSIIFLAAHDNTGASTLAVDGGSAIPIKKTVSVALAAGDILAGGVVEVVYDGTNFQLVTGASGGGGGSGTVTTVLGPQDCTTDLSGNVAYDVDTLTNFNDAHWRFKAGAAATLYCKVRIPHPVAGTPNAKILLEIRDNDTSNSHTANFKTCDILMTTNYQVGALTCASNQTYTATATAYDRVTKTFTVQSTVSADNYLFFTVVSATTGTQPTNDMEVDLAFQIDQTL